MGLVMNMSNYEIEHSSMETEYGEEVMCAGWNPAIVLAAQLQPDVPASRPAPMPADLATVDANAFLQKMYEYQR